MIKPDIILVWPRNSDYPLWRLFIRKERERFGKVLVVFMNPQSGDDYREFVKQAMAPDNITFIESATAEELGSNDWRHAAIYKALPLVTSDWIWFTEQDFFPKADFFNELNKLFMSYPIIGIKEGDRLHPCSLFIRKDLIGKTGKNFGIVKDTSDHFSIFTKQLYNLNERVAFIDKSLYMHMAGLTSNLSLIEKEEQPNYKRDDFYKYLKASLIVPVPRHEKYKLLVENALKRSF